jgi:SAM-dependent methyltransferase
MMHRPLENATSAKDMLLDAVGFIGNLDGSSKQNQSNLVAPHEAEVTTRLRWEKQHLRQVYAYSKSEERIFWKEYLRNFQYIINIHDFFKLLECMYENLGGVWPGQKILDAGCGIGNFGLFLLTKQLYKVQQDPQLLSRDAAHYVGVDFIETAILDARIRMGQLLGDYRGKISIVRSAPILRSSFVRADLDGGLPFSSDFFDQICCNLVLSYVQRPDFVLRELWRVLRPGSKMVISSLKPSADLSEVYRNFVSVAETPEELEQGRELLNNAGMIKLKEVRGLYQFYSTNELKAKVREAGFTRAKAMLSFGDQASVVVCSKA